MDIYQLQYFKTVADHKNLTKAADVLHITQPALSRAIAALENELGVRLFSRQNRKMVLNKYGDVFYRRTARILKDISYARQELLALCGKKPDSLVLHTAMPEYFSALSIAYLAKNPTVTLKEFPQSGYTPEQALIFGEMSLAITSCPYGHPSLEWFHLLDEEMVLLTPPSHPLADAGRALLSAFKNDRFITTAMGTELHQRTTSYCKAADFDPAVAVEAPEIEAVRMLVSRGCGVAFMARSVLERIAMPHMDQKHLPFGVVEITEPKCRRPVGVAIQRNRLLSETEYDFLTFLTDFFRQDPLPETQKGGALAQFARSHYFPATETEA